MMGTIFSSCRRIRQAWDQKAEAATRLFDDDASRYREKIDKYAKLVETCGEDLLDLRKIPGSRREQTKKFKDMREYKRHHAMWQAKLKQMEREREAVELGIEHIREGKKSEEKSKAIRKAGLTDKTAIDRSKKQRETLKNELDGVHDINKTVLEDQHTERTTRTLADEEHRIRMDLDDDDEEEEENEEEEETGSNIGAALDRWYAQQLNLPSTQHNHIKKKKKKGNEQMKMSSSSSSGSAAPSAAQYAFIAGGSQEEEEEDADDTDSNEAVEIAMGVPGPAHQQQQQQVDAGLAFKLDNVMG
jgi:hypothetical protein